LLDIERKLWTNDAAFHEASLLEEALLVFPGSGAISRGFAVDAIRRENAEGVGIKNEAVPIVAIASSLYVRREGAWKLAFRQQTPRGTAEYSSQGP
jgi:hypothetical protein